MFKLMTLTLYGMAKGKVFVVDRRERGGGQPKASERV